MCLGNNENFENFEQACKRSHATLCAKNEALRAKSETFCITTISST
jgi:hypothetical protein